MTRRAVLKSLWRLGPALLAWGLAGCMPLPTLKPALDLSMPAARVPPEAVQTEYVTVPGFPEPHTPERYNRSYYLRYYVAESEPTQTVLVLVPGIFGGATSFDPLARLLVASFPGLEVWAVDRRANALEDRRAAVETLATGDPTPAYEFYIANAGEADGFEPVPPDEVRFMAYWGLDVHLRDLHEIIKSANGKAPRVILGGHSLGASLVSFYAAYDFGEGQETDPGYAHIDGLVLLDGALGRTGGFARPDRGLSVGPIQLIATAAELEAGEGNPYFSFAFSPTLYARSEAKALLALLEPLELAPPGLEDFPVTNRALLGLSRDDQYGPSPIFSVSIGDAVGAEFNGNLVAVLLDGLEGVYSKSVVGVADGYDYVDWTPGDPARERTDLETFVRAWALPETNYSEWYFPVRLLIDTLALDVTLADEPGFVPNAEVPTPTLALGASRGLLPSLDGFAAYAVARAGSPFSSFVLPGLTHADITTARDNPVVPLFGRWLARLPN